MPIIGIDLGTSDRAVLVDFRAPQFLARHRTVLEFAAEKARWERGLPVGHAPGAAVQYGRIMQCGFHDYPLLSGADPTDIGEEGVPPIGSAAPSGK